MLAQIRDPRARRRSPSILVALVALALAATTAAAESRGEAPQPFEAMEGVPAEWTAALNAYVADPSANGPRLIAIERAADGNLPPLFQVVIADAYLRAGNRRAAERLFDGVLASDPGYPWEEFGNLGMGAVRMMSGDPAEAQQYFARVADAPEGSSRALGNLGLGSALAAAGRFDEARVAFDEVGSSTSVDEEVRLAGRFGSATALYGAGDVAGAAEAFEAIAASDPDGPIGRDARYAAARARLALGDRDAATAALRSMADDCGDERRTRRAPRALRDLDPRAIGRTWVRNYQRTPWTRLQAEGTSMYSIDGCTLARSTLRAVEHGDASLGAVQQVAAGTATEPRAAAPAETRRERVERGEAASTPAAASAGAGWLPLAVAALAAAVLAFLWLRRARAGGV
jgi:tetratricopeptide (TPR) repeat protein